MLVPFRIPSIIRHLILRVPKNVILTTIHMKAKSWNIVKGLPSPPSVSELISHHFGIVFEVEVWA